MSRRIALRASLRDCCIAATRRPFSWIDAVWTVLFWHVECNDCRRFPVPLLRSRRVRRAHIERENIVATGGGRPQSPRLPTRREAGSTARARHKLSRMAFGRKTQGERAPYRYGGSLGEESELFLLPPSRHRSSTDRRLCEFGTDARWATVFLRNHWENR